MIQGLKLQVFEGSMILGGTAMAISFRDDKLTISNVSCGAAIALLQLLSNASDTVPAEASSPAPAPLATVDAEKERERAARAIPLTTTPIVMSRVGGPPALQAVTPPTALEVVPAPVLVAAPPVVLQPVAAPVPAPAEAPTVPARRRLPRRETAAEQAAAAQAAQAAQPVQQELPPAPVAAPAPAPVAAPVDPTAEQDPWQLAANASAAAQAAGPMIYDERSGMMRAAPVEAPSAPPPPPVAKPAAPAAAPTGDLNMDAIRELTKLKDLLSYLLAQGIAKDQLAATCKRLQPEVALLDRIGENLAERVGRTIDVLFAAGS